MDVTTKAIIETIGAARFTVALDVEDGREVVTVQLAVDRQVRTHILSWMCLARAPVSRFTRMAKRPKRKNASAKPPLAEERIVAIKAEIAQALIQRNTLPKSATDEEKDAAAARVEQLQAQHHEAVQRALAVKREETTKFEREHKESKQRHRRLRASRQPGDHAEPHEEHAIPPRHTSVHRPVDRAAEEAQMDAINEEDLRFERQQLEEEDRKSAHELAQQQVVAEEKRKKKEAAKRQEAKNREKKDAKATAEAVRLKAEREARAKIRQQAALHSAEEAKAKKRQHRAEREARPRIGQAGRSSGWFSEVLRQLKTFFGGPR